MIVEVSGLVTKAYGRDLFTYSVHDGERSVEFSSRQFFQPGDCVKARCASEERAGKAVLVSEEVQKTPDVYSEVENRVMERIALQNAEIGSELAAMLPQFENMARKLRAAGELGRFVMVKFHGDADGISSALILRKFLRANYSQQNSAIYGVADAIRDMERAGQQFKPLILLVDFGSGGDSSEGIELAKAAGLEMASIDHHPPGVGPAPFAAAANPWLAGIDDGSRYPAGFLCSKIAALLGFSSDGLERIACAGDKSDAAPVTAEDRENALVLDFVATYSGNGGGLDFYSNVLDNKEVRNSVLLQANAKMEELDALLEKNVKVRQLPKATIHLINLDAVSEKREFPGKGKVATRLFEKVRDSGPVIVLGVGRKSMIFRLNDAALQNGIRGNELIARMRQRFSDFVENGGGHARAAALRIREGYENAAVEEIIKIVGEY